MKNMIISGLLLGCISLMACKKEEIDKNKIAANLIIGEWLQVKYGIEIPIGAKEALSTYDVQLTYHFELDSSLKIGQNQSIPDKWQIMDEGKMFHLEKDPSAYYIIQKLDKDSLIYYSEYFESGDYIRRHEYFIRKK